MCANSCDCNYSVVTRYCCVVCVYRQEMQSNLNKLVEQEEVEAKEEFLHQIRMKNENFHRQIQDLEKDGR